MVCININLIQKDQSLWQVSKSSSRAWLWWKDLSRATDCWCTYRDRGGVVRDYSNDGAGWNKIGFQLEFYSTNRWHFSIP